MYWVEAPIWAGAELDSALRLLCTPRVLIDEQAAEGEVAQPDLTERALIRDGFDDPRIVAFGLRGAAAGFASWSGVSYAPLVTRRALTASQLVRFEIVVQSLWCYCHHVRSQVETGADPVIPDEFGWRWLRAVRARLSGARPTESAQHASMRSAILETSELLRHLNGTMEVLRDSALEGNR
jgi:hypothetical protein